MAKAGLQMAFCRCVQVNLPCLSQGDAGLPQAGLCAALAPLWSASASTGQSPERIGAHSLCANGLALERDYTPMPLAGCYTGLRISCLGDTNSALARMVNPLDGKGATPPDSKMKGLVFREIAASLLIQDIQTVPAPRTQLRIP